MLGFIRKDATFFEMFSDITRNLIAGSQVLVQLFDDYQGRGERTAEIKRIEHVGDDLTHSVLRKLNQTFITPFDREDIHHLASSLDDVLDFVNAAAERTSMYKINDPPPAAGKLSKLVLAQCKELGEAVAHLRRNGDVLERCIEIKRLENEADVVSREAIGRLFEAEKDALNLIKVKELLEVLETATDKAEDAANVLETVVLKNT
jgi:predicted phosphate transport protein (TIGR00153 family)